MSEHWPPNSMDEHDLHRDEDSRLPKQLYPYRIEPTRDADTRRVVPGPWRLYYAADSRKPQKLLSEHPDIWRAFQAMFRAYRDWFPTRPIERVYFIGTRLERGCLIKVGYSRDPDGRLRTLQTAHPERLRILATTPGGKAEEAKYHRRWHARRRSGEWFTVGDCIIDEINRLNEHPSPSTADVGASHG